MAVARLSAGELRELLADLVSVTTRVVSAIETCPEVEPPDEVYDALMQHTALLETLKELPEELRARIRTAYVQNMTHAEPQTENWPLPRVLGESEGELNETLEVLRRACLRDSELAELIHDRPAW